jgi:hypothetical protein
MSERDPTAMVGNHYRCSALLDDRIDEYLKRRNEEYAAGGGTAIRPSKSSVTRELLDKALCAEGL